MLQLCLILQCPEIDLFTQVNVLSWLSVSCHIPVDNDTVKISFINFWLSVKAQNTEYWDTYKIITQNIHLKVLCLQKQMVSVEHHVFDVWYYSLRGFNGQIIYSSWE